MHWSSVLLLGMSESGATGSRRIRRVRNALQLVFAKFAEFQSARQVHLWLRDEGIELPVKSRDGEARGVVWRLPAYNIVHNILTNPIYAGAYAFGRTTSKVSVEQGRKRVRRGVHRPMAEWDVLIKDHHAAYITWEEFERNQRVIANNATGKGSATVKGAIRRGELLLPGLLRCGHCGRKLHVSYSGKLGRYSCYGARTKSRHGALHHDQRLKYRRCRWRRGAAHPQAARH